ncbi:hypothetical protein ABKV19_017051 [Rosa sericea]
MACHKVAAASFQLLSLVSFLLFLSPEATTIFANSNTVDDERSNVACIEEERKALLEFKQGLQDPLLALHSWVGKDCCNWHGIVCNNQTGNIIELRLLHTQISGRLPVSIGSLSHLETLDLFNNSFSDPLPISIGNLSHLQTLVLSFNSISGLFPISIGNLPNLQSLDLSSNSISGPLPTSIGNLLNLQSLDLSFNSISGPLPTSIGNLSNLQNLDLWNNPISGLFPISIRNLSNLQDLSLQGNAISGPLPTWIGNLRHLQSLDLSYNSKMNGTIPESIGQLRELNYLDLSDCSWEGSISENHFQNTSRLDSFFLFNEASTSLVFNVSHDWIPVFNLTYLYISDCKLMDTAFPLWLRSQKFLNVVSLERVGISDTIPDWFWRFSPFLEDVRLSHNQLRGNLPKSPSSPLQNVYLSNNSLVGSLPLWPYVTHLSLASNRFSGPIPLNIGHEMSELQVLRLSRNNLTGSFPPSLSKIKSLEILDLSRNYFSGNIPRDWKGLQDLMIIDFSNNNLSGGIPSCMCSQLPSLKWLRLSNNNLSGDLQLSLQDCGTLFTLDLTGNKFSGIIPKWVGENLQSLSYLLLGSNKFTGNIPHQICDLSSLQVLDLSQNNISGSIPSCLGGLKQMTTGDGLLGDWMSDLGFYGSVYDPMHIDLNVKGVEYEYIADIIGLIQKIDLSSNNLWGEIPEEVKNLMALGSLNLSHNHLTGKIPEGIGSLHELEALDLSSNHLWGLIPSSMTSLTSLSELNLSFNNFSGPIPSANQFPTFDPTSFEGNSGLCGPPLPTQCSSASHNDPAAKVEEDEEDKDGKLWFYASTALGFIVGFWVVFGSLVLKRSWRHAYFQFLDNMKQDLLLFLEVTRVSRSLRAWKMVD